MAFPHNRSTRPRSKGFRSRQSSKGAVLLIILAGFVGISAVALLVTRGAPVSFAATDASGEARDLAPLWEEGRYDALIEQTERILAREPMDAYALLFNGLSNYYASLSEQDGEQSKHYLERARTSLRRALVLPEHPYQGHLEYVLGMTYYHMGTAYAAYAVDYLERSLSTGFVGPEVHEYLGLAYAELEQYEQSVGHFEQALDDSGREALYITLIRSYLDADYTEEALETARFAAEALDDEYLRAEAKLLLGRTYLELDRLAEAQEELESVTEQDLESADAHYWLGQVFSRMEDHVRARAEWRNAISIEPNHAEALKQLDG